ncbi:MAG: TolC family protein [bacterium]
MKKKFNLSIGLICAMLLATGNFAKAETITFDNVYDKTKTYSQELKISNIEIGISKTELKSAKADYYPTLTAGSYAEYTRDLTKKTGGSGGSSISSVGSSVVSSASQYQNLLNINLSYNLFDFGVIHKKVVMAKKDVEEKNILYKQSLVDLKMKLLDVYTKGLILNKSIKALNQMLPVAQSLYDMKQELYKEGFASKLQVSDESINVMKLKNEILDNQIEFKKVLTDLSSYTHENYDIENTELSDFDNQDYIVPIANKSNRQNLKYKVYQLEIEKKKAELESMKRQKLPNIKLYTSFGLYGADRSDFLKSVNNIGTRNLTAGISASLPLFDGFKNSANCDRLKMELKKLQLQKEQAEEDYNSSLDKLTESLSSYKEEKKNYDILLGEVSEKLAMLNQLSQEKLTDKASVEKQKQELIKQKLEYEKNRIIIASSIRKIETLLGT